MCNPFYALLCYAQISSTRTIVCHDASSTSGKCMAMFGTSHKEPPTLERAPDGKTGCCLATCRRLLRVRSRNGWSCLAPPEEPSNKLAGGRKTLGGAYELAAEGAIAATIQTEVDRETDGPSYAAAKPVSKIRSAGCPQNGSAHVAQVCANGHQKMARVKTKFGEALNQQTIWWWRQPGAQRVAVLRHGRATVYTHSHAQLDSATSSWWGWQPAQIKMRNKFAMTPDTCARLMSVANMARDVGRGTGMLARVGLQSCRTQHKPSRNSELWS